MSEESLCLLADRSGCDGLGIATFSDNRVVASLIELIRELIFSAAASWGIKGKR